MSDVVSAVQNDSSKLIITASKEKSYKCADSQDIVLNGNVKVTVTMKKIQVQPFGSEFGDGKKTSNIFVCLIVDKSTLKLKIIYLQTNFYSSALFILEFFDSMLKNNAQRVCQRLKDSLCFYMINFKAKSLWGHI